MANLTAEQERRRDDLLDRSTLPPEYTREQPSTELGRLRGDYEQADIDEKRSAADLNLANIEHVKNKRTGQILGNVGSGFKIAGGLMDIKDVAQKREDARADRETQINFGQAQESQAGILESEARDTRALGMRREDLANLDVAARDRKSALLSAYDNKFRGM